jgi:hypothetical protein
LTSGRAGLPPYHAAGRYFTLVLPAARARRNGPGGGQPGVSVRQASRDDLPGVLDFLNANGPRRQFFPKYSPADFFQPRGALRDLRAEDLLLAFRGGRLAGTLGVWDQRGFRQSVVERYSARWRWLRPFYNGWASLSGRPLLPACGRPFEHVVAAIPVVADDDADTFQALLCAARSRAAEVKAGHLLIGFSQDDPLFPAVRSSAVAAYATRLYYVCWQEGDALRQALDGRVPYLELGAL